MKSKVNLEDDLKILAESTLDFPWEDKSAYACWLAQTYFYVCQSTRLLALAASRFDVDQHPIHLRFLEHLREEHGHEHLAIRDLKGLGFDIKQFTEFPETSAFYQTQYYWLEHKDPISFFGWILCLEGLAVREGKTVHERVSKAHGKNCAHFLKVHAQEDIDHVEKAKKMVASVDDKQAQIIQQNLRESRVFYQHMLSQSRQIKISGKKAA